MICPKCGAPLTEYPKYMYCYRCSSQFKRSLFGGLKEMKSSLASDQRRALSRRD